MAFCPRVVTAEEELSSFSALISPALSLPLLSSTVTTLAPVLLFCMVILPVRES